MNAASTSELMSVMVQEDIQGSPDAVSVEAALVKAALGGDGRAFATLVKPHLNVLYRIAVRACADATTAEDAVQEALTLAFQRLDRYRADTSLRAYLASIVVKRVHTLLRSDRRRRTREATGPVPRRVDTPEDLARAAQTGARIRDAIGTLPRKRREVVLLRLDGKLSDSEIADAVGSTTASVGVLVHLALKDLKAALSAQEG